MFVMKGQRSRSRDKNCSEDHWVPNDRRMASTLPFVPVLSTGAVQGPPDLI
jgi:hypothetical protein